MRSVVDGTRRVSTTSTVTVHVSVPRRRPVRPSQLQPSASASSRGPGGLRRGSGVLGGLVVLHAIAVGRSCLAPAGPARRPLTALGLVHALRSPALRPDEPLGAPCTRSCDGDSNTDASRWPNVGVRGSGAGARRLVAPAG